MWVTCLDINYLFLVAYHLPRIPGNSGWDANGKRVFGSSHWKIPGTTAEILKISGISVPAVNGTRFVGSSHWKILRKSGKSKKAGPFSRLEFPNGISCSIYTFSRGLYQFQVHGKKICHGQLANQNGFPQAHVSMHGLFFCRPYKEGTFAPRVPWPCINW